MTVDGPNPAGGWVTIRRVSDAERAAQREQGQRDAEALQARLASAHAAVFGGVTDRSVIEHRMPLSGWLFRWRADGHLQVIRPGEPAEEADWHPWTPPEDAGAFGEGGVAAGDSAEPTWWLWWGICQPDDEIRGWLADDRDVAVTRVGWVWIVEFVSAPQPLFLEHNGRLHTFGPHRPAYLPPATHPFSRTAPNPRET